MKNRDRTPFLWGRSSVFYSNGRCYFVTARSAPPPYHKSKKQCALMLTEQNSNQKTFRHMIMF